jgi:hypothetical protein
MFPSSHPKGLCRQRTFRLSGGCTSSSGQSLYLVQCSSSTWGWGCLASIGRRRAASIGCTQHEGMSEKTQMNDRCSTSQHCETARFPASLHAIRVAGWRRRRWAPGVRKSGTKNRYIRRPGQSHYFRHTFYEMVEVLTVADSGQARIGILLPNSASRRRCAEADIAILVLIQCGGEVSGRL